MPARRSQSSPPRTSTTEAFVYARSRHDAASNRPSSGSPLKRGLAGGFELDDDRGRIDRAAVHDFIANHSYWARGRPRETMDELIETAARVVGLYLDERQIGFTRTISDGHTRSYLADVYVLPEFRGRGLGGELVRFTVDEGPLAETPWLLHTADAHELYRRFGFEPPGDRLLERKRH